MKERRDLYGVRTDFPVNRLLRVFVLGNMMTIGGLYLLVVGGEMINLVLYELREGNLDTVIFEMIAAAARNNLRIIRAITAYPGLIAILLGVGSMLSMVWYVVARLIETRYLKKRWLVISKSR